MENLISVTTTARYDTLGTISKDIKAVWFVFHGYGMLSSEFVKEFECINDSQTLIVSPEGMHRFYKRSTQGVISASWMTSDLREEDITNNINYLNCVLEDIKSKGLSKDFQLGVLGFSQGGPTSFRWASQLDKEIGVLIAWGTDIPKDVISNGRKLQKINRSNIKLIIGSKDEYVSSDKVDNVIMELHDDGVDFDFHTFDGKHELHEESIRYFHSRLMDDNLEY
jgi:predicted esterase